MHTPNRHRPRSCPPCPDDATSLDKLLYWWGIGLGSGRARFAPGTWGTLAALGVAALVLHLAPSLLWYLVGAGLVFGSWICGACARLMGVHDDGHIVFDEWVGVWIACLVLTPMFVRALESTALAPLVLHLPDWDFWAQLVWIFGLFRAFDILKPFPIRLLDKHVKGGFGILLDDVLAGLFAGTVFILGQLWWARLVML